MFDFSLRTDDSPYGIWFSIGAQGALPQPTTIGQVNLAGAQLLLAGFIDGSVRMIDTDQQRSISISQPAHLGLCMKLPSTYLGAIVQPSPTGLARTGSLQPTPGRWSEGMYIELFHKGANNTASDTDATGIRPPTPTLNMYYDDINPFSPDGPTSLTAQALPTNEKRAWLQKGPGLSACGTLAKRFQFEMKFMATTTDGASRPQLLNDELWMFGFAWLPHSDLTL